MSLPSCSRQWMHQVAGLPDPAQGGAQCYLAAPSQHAHFLPRPSVTRVPLEGAPPRCRPSARPSARPMFSSERPTITSARPQLSFKGVRQRTWMTKKLSLIASIRPECLARRLARAQLVVAKQLAPMDAPTGWPPGCRPRHRAGFSKCRLDCALTVVPTRTCMFRGSHQRQRMPPECATPMSALARALARAPSFLARAPRFLARAPRCQQSVAQRK